MIFSLISIELYKIFKKWRTYIGFAAFGVFIPIMIYGISISGNFYLRNLSRSLGDDFLIVGNLLNGWFVAFLVFQLIIVHVPFFITLVAGDLFAGEGTAGTYRMLLTRPVSREMIVISKFIAGFIYAFVFILFFAFMSLVPSLVSLGSGDLLILIDKFIVISEHDILWRFILAYLSAFISMCLVVSLGALFSSFVNNAIGPIVGTMAVIVIFLIINQLPFEIFEKISPYLFTKYMTVWLDFFEYPVDWKKILESISVLIGHIILFFAITLFTFRKKDILT
ncbi:MAG: ABC transporter permease [Ignavibacteria bacterium]|jgi:ABC-2 type transport system permease protein|nr:ABC transporter permease [Ignavibacteria bacterium]MDH7528648.1 ABC transporter permease [Ignavibacteria bacterium]